MKVGLDIDDVIADLMPEWLASFNKEHGTGWTPDDLTQWEFQKDLDCSYEDILKHLQPTLYDTVKPTEDALETVNTIRRMGHHIVYISSCHDEETWNAKQAWLYKHGFLEAGDSAYPVGNWCYYQTKRDVGLEEGISIIVDDRVETCEDWPGVAYLLTLPHNRRSIYMGKRLKKLKDLILELKHFPKPTQTLEANAEGWVGGEAPTIGFYDPPEFNLLPEQKDANFKPSNPKDIIGSGKMPFHLFPKVALIHGTLAMLEGAMKYGRSNFDEVGVKATIYVDAAIRHLNAYQAGQDRAPDSGLHHLGHAIACCAILLNAEAQENLVDDRDYKGEAYLKAIENETKEVNRIKEKYSSLTPKHYTRADRGKTI